MRLDVYLTENGIYKSRTRAQQAIRSGCVSIRGKTELRPSADINGDDTDHISCLPDPLEYVGRGALKLDFALEHFGIDVTGLDCVDVGASTGGFTQVLLKRSAGSVTAIDVGHGQLDELISSDPRVVDLEGTDFRDFSPGKQFGFLSMDVSFISITMLKDKVSEVLKPGGNAVILFKPQFEVGRRHIGKGGIVRSVEAVKSAMSSAVSAYATCGLSLIDSAESPVKGGDGNTEYLLWFRRCDPAF